MYGKPCASRHPGPDDRPSRRRSLAPARRLMHRGALSFSAHSGLNKVFFQGRISISRTNKLKPGRYTLIMPRPTQPASARTPRRSASRSSHSARRARLEPGPARAFPLAVAFAVLGVSDDMPSPPRREPEAVAMGTPVALLADEWNPSAVRFRSACDRDPPSHAKHGTPPRASATPHPEITGPKIGLESRAGTRKGCMTGFR